MEKPMTHAEISKGLPSASGFDSCFRCLGKWELEKQFGEEPESADARRGDRIHRALERSDLSELTGGEQLTASICMDIEGQMTDQHNFEDAEDVIWEKRMWDVDDDLTALWSVQVDYLRLSRNKRRALVIDHKTGWGIPVPIKYNWQIRAEAAIVWYHYGVDEVVAVLAHPHHPDSRYEVAIYTAKDCADFLVTIRGNVALIQQPDQPRTPNGTSCQHCRARHICPERQAYLDKVGQDVINEIRERGYTALLDRNPEQRGEHYRSVKSLLAQCELIMEKYTSMVAADPDSVKGFRLVKGWTRSIKDEVEAMELVEKEFGEKVANDSMVFSLTELETALQRSLKIGKTKATARVEACLHDVLKWTPKRPWLTEQRYYGEAYQSETG
jgi:hypothetical protein